MSDIGPMVSPSVAGEDRCMYADTHLSRDRCQNKATVSRYIKVHLTEI